MKSKFKHLTLNFEKSKSEVQLVQSYCNTYMENFNYLPILSDEDLQAQKNFLGKYPIK